MDPITRYLEYGSLFCTCEWDESTQIRTGSVRVSDVNDGGSDTCFRWAPVVASKQGPRLFIRHHWHRSLSLRLTSSTDCKMKAVARRGWEGDVDTGRDPARCGWDGECSSSRCRRSVPGQAEPGEGAAYERGRSGASQGSGPRPAWPVPVGRLLYPRRGGGFPRRGLLQSVHRRVLLFLRFGSEFDVSGMEFRLLLWFW